MISVFDFTQFLPANPALLGNNMNAGQRINLRLRPPGNTSTFYEYDQLVLVMLHEVSSHPFSSCRRQSVGTSRPHQAVIDADGQTLISSQLAHIEHGPHDANFYRLLGELEEEYWGLKRKGYSGRIFISRYVGSQAPGSASNDPRRRLPRGRQSPIQLKSSRAYRQSQRSCGGGEAACDADENWQGWGARWVGDCGEDDEGGAGRGKLTGVW
jgi:hypothetical protein